MSKITAEHIEKAKAKHGSIYLIEVAKAFDFKFEESKESINDLKALDSSKFSPKKGYIYAILEKPDKKTIGYSMTHKDPIQMGNFILKNSMVEIDDERFCDEEIFTEDEPNMAAALQAVGFVEVGQASIKKY